MENKFKNKKVVVMGLGLNGGGVAVAKFFCQQGAKVIVSDKKTKEQLDASIESLKGLPITFDLGQHSEEIFISADLIIKNPAVRLDSPILQIARNAKVPIKTDIEIFLELCKGEIIGVTGTKGKSTVASLIAHILKQKFPDVVLAGNIGISPLEYLENISRKTKVILELSSFELETLQTSPKIAVFTAIYPDHLDRYKNMQEYLASKMPIFLHQKKSDILLLDFENKFSQELAKKAKSQVYFYSQKSGIAKSLACYAKDGKVFFGGDKKAICSISDISIKGTHNISNALAAISVACFYEIPYSEIRSAVSSFPSVPNRQEFVAEINGVKFFNDTTATMPEAAIAALHSFSAAFPDSGIILIAGGQNKGLEYTEFAAIAKKIAKKIILLPGTATELIKKHLNFSTKQKNSKIILSDSMEDAVKKSFASANPGDIVVLSPASASFNLFENEFDRGRQFVKNVMALKNGK